MFRIILPILIFFILAGCSGYTAASLSSNIVSYSTTGKTNTDHVISYLSGKDCKVFRVAVNKEICKRNNSELAFSTDIIEDKTTFIESVTNSTIYLTKNIAKDHVMLGAKIADKIGLTKQLEEKTEAKFDSVLLKEKQNVIKKEIVDEKKFYKKRPWEVRVEKAEKERRKFKQKFLKTFKKIKIYTSETNSIKAAQKNL